MIRSVEAAYRALPPVTFIINDRPDIAALTGAAGVHVGQDDLTGAGRPQDLSDPAWVGVSTHNIEQFRAADTTSADYIAVGPIFATATKENPDPVVGLGLFAQARQITKTPCRHWRDHSTVRPRHISSRCRLRRRNWGFESRRRSWRARSRVSGNRGSVRARASVKNEANRHKAEVHARNSAIIASRNGIRRTGQRSRPVRFHHDCLWLDGRLRHLHRLR